MSQAGSGLIHWIEERLAKRPPPFRRFPVVSGTRRPALRDGTRVIVVGGGMAGSAFARQLARLTHLEGIRAEVTVLNSINCNYCGGLVTNLSADTLEGLYDLSVPSDRVLARIDECIYANAEGRVQVPLDPPLASILRTSRFGEPGFDDAFKERMAEGLPPEAAQRLKLIEPARVVEMTPPAWGSSRGPSKPPPGEPARVTFMRHSIGGKPILESVEGDILVIATGLRSLGMKALDEFAERTGFELPRVMPASVTELDVSSARLNRLSHSVLVADGIIPGCVAAIIPKRRDWLTITSLRRVLTPEDVTWLLEHPSVRQLIDLPKAGEHLRCKKVCPANVCIGPSSGFYGDGWLVVGDLTGYGRVLKDGYFAALDTADLAALTLVYQGSSREVLRKYYEAPLKRRAADNRAGMNLFWINTRLSPTRWFSRLLVSAAQSEKRRSSYGGPIHAAIRAITMGELSYRVIWGLFIWGFVRYLALLPWFGLAASRRPHPKRT